MSESGTTTNDLARVAWKRACQQASFAICLWAMAHASMVTVAVAQADPARLTPRNIIPSAVLVTLFLGLLLFLATAVRKGRRVTAALVFAALYGIGPAIIVAIMLAGKYDGSGFLVGAMVVLLMAWIWAVWRLSVAWRLGE